MLRLFKGIALERLGNLRIALAVGLTAHCQVHTHLGALAVEIVVETFQNLGILYVLGHAKHVLGHKHQRALGLCYFNEFFTRHAAQGAFLGSGVTFVDISAYGASKFCHICQ